MNDFSGLWSSQTITPSSWLTILVSLLLAFVVGLFIAWIYRRNYRGVMYSNNFTLTLVLMTLITCPVVMCIRESIALSMGMVGALSIVRFRTAVKDPLDTAYMFWALTMGILLGAGQFFLTVLTVVGIAVLITVLVQIQSRKMNSFLLVLRMGEEAERAAHQIVGSVRLLRRRRSHLRGARGQARRPAEQAACRAGRVRRNARFLFRRDGLIGGCVPCIQSFGGGII